MGKKEEFLICENDVGLRLTPGLHLKLLRDVSLFVLFLVMAKLWHQIQESMMSFHPKYCLALPFAEGPGWKGVGVRVSLQTRPKRKVSMNELVVRKMLERFSLGKEWRINAILKCQF